MFNKDRSYSIGVVVTTYNRPEYLNKTFNSIKQSFIPEYTRFNIIDDCSTNRFTLKLLKEFDLEGIEVDKTYKKENKGVWDSLKIGFDWCKENEFDIYCNIDSDVLLNKLWLSNLKNLYYGYRDSILTAFNPTNSVKYGTMKELNGCYERSKICGVNLLFGKHLYKYILKSLEYEEMWDIELNNIAKKIKFISTKPSLIQHIGNTSSMNHGQPARAKDFLI